MRYWPLIALAILVLLLAKFSDQIVERVLGMLSVWDALLDAQMATGREDRDILAEAIDISKQDGLTLVEAIESIARRGLAGIL